MVCCCNETQEELKVRGRQRDSCKPRRCERKWQCLLSQLEPTAEWLVASIIFFCCCDTEIYDTNRTDARRKNPLPRGCTAPPSDIGGSLAFYVVMIAVPLIRLHVPASYPSV